MQSKRTILKVALSSELPNSDSFSRKPYSKLVLTRTNSADLKCTPKFHPESPFSHEQSSFRENLRSSFRRTPKPILKTPNKSFENTLQQDVRPDNSLLLKSYHIKDTTSRNRTKYRNPYKDFDSVLYERKEKRFFGTMSYFFTFLIVFCIIALTVSQMMNLNAALKEEPILIAESQSNAVSPSMSQEPFNLDISTVFIANDSITKDAISRKIAAMKRQFIRSRYG